MTENERKKIEKCAKIKLIDHFLDALCKCELTDKGREFMKEMKKKLQQS